MSSRAGRVPELASDPKRTRLLADHLIKALEQYVNRHPRTTYADVFMAAHNFHKVAVLDVASRSGMTGDHRMFYFQMAVDTLGQALSRDHARLLLEEGADEEVKRGPPS
jgi:hypothetical protein